MPEKRQFERLPTDVVPKNYELVLKPDLAEFTFEGKEAIDVEVKQSTGQIVMNCADIDIISASFCHQGGKEINASGFNYENQDERVTLSFPSALEPGPGKLKLEFVGELNDKLRGFYRSKYVARSGEIRFAAVTQFEPTDARRAFPCWDEPAIKATFDLSLIVPRDRVALSNMQEIKRVPQDDEQGSSGEGLVRVTFARSPIMSTYLVAFVVGEFDFVEAQSSDGVLVRVYAPLGKAEHGRFALQVATKTLPFYKDYFDVPYPLPKIDLIAVADFATGAMENWGLVTYRELALLVDPKNSSAEAKQKVALVVGHELAHQWFGNLVTMEWWTHLWLNEGFASWIEYLCVDHCFPEFDIWTQFVSTDYAPALELDALDNSHPIEVPVGHPSEVDEIFDTISYSKGASVIRMLHNYIGDEDFRKGMHLYLTKFQYKNAATQDLWDCLEEASGKPVSAVMCTWTTQMGFPVLHVTAEQQGNDRILKISQKKFCAGGVFSGEICPQWMVPISVSTSEDPNAIHTTVLLDKPEMTVTIKNIDPKHWIKLNPGTVGFCRVSYTSDMLYSLIPAIRDLSLPARDRMDLQNDLMALARAGVVSAVEVLKVLEAFKNETNYTVWLDLSGNLSSIAVLLINTDFYSNFQDYVIDLFAPIGARLGWDPKPGEGHLDALLRSIALGRLGRAGHPPTLEEARRRFHEHTEGKKVLHPDLRQMVYVTVLKHGDAAVLDTLLKMHKHTDQLEERVRIERIVGASPTAELLQKVLNFSISDEVRSQDTVFVIGGVAGSSKLGMSMAWRFVQEKWAELSSRYQGGFLLPRLIKMTTDNFASEKKANQVKEFFEKNPTPSAERTVQQSCENILLNAAWLNRDGEALRAYLQGRKCAHLPPPPQPPSQPSHPLASPPATPTSPIAPTSPTKKK
ncbi:puromycin-sensitive aminopeptidase-like [Petromyzon marinus]|uniref:Aminopeptidase n=1 Tax=Petromyzon marinus TaxID=7757 RepID=A0AAJ7WWX0_PETMA|nr:puromycin-sensitive aminopeptidase-like [Petromyzon marinus]